MSPIAKLAGVFGGNSDPTTDANEGDRRPLMRYGAALAIIVLCLGGALYLFVGRGDVAR